MKFLGVNVPPLTEILRESYVPTINPVDPDEDLFRRATQTVRDLNPVEQSKMIEWAAWLYDRNPLARRLIEIQRDFVLGEGLTLFSSDAAVMKVLLKHWKSDINNWEIKGEQRFNDLRLFGEAIWTVNETLGSGKVILGVVDPGRVKDVIRDPGQIDEPDIVVLNPLRTSGIIGDDGPVGVQYKVIRENPETERLEGAKPNEIDITVSLGGQPTRASYTGFAGSVFYYAINKVATASRGRSDLFALIDYLDGADQFLWSQLERAKLANAMVFDVSVDGTDRDVQNEETRIRQKQPTRPGTVNVHTKNIVWEQLVPNLGEADNEILATQMMRWILGGVGLPEAWFGKGADTNRSTIEGQTDPALKRMTAIQKNWFYIVNRVLRYQYERANLKGAKLKEVDWTSDLPWQLQTPDMSSKDVSRIGAAIAQLTVSIGEAQQLQYISEESGRRAFLSFLQMLGLDFNSEDEKKAIDKEQAKLKQDPTYPTTTGKNAPDQQAALAQETQQIKTAGTPSKNGSNGSPSASKTSKGIGNYQKEIGSADRAFNFGESLYDGTSNDRAMIAFYPDSGIQAMLTIPGGQLPSEMHLTLAYLGEASALQDRRDDLYTVLSTFSMYTRPIAAKISGLGTFPGHEENPGGVLFAAVDGPELMSFRQKLVGTLLEHGYPVSQDHQFVPHITLAYGQEIPEAYRDPKVIPGMTFRDFVLVIGDDKYIFPLNGYPNQDLYTSEGLFRVSKKAEGKLELEAVSDQ